MILFLFLVNSSPESIALLGPGPCCPAAVASKLTCFSDFWPPSASASEDWHYFFANAVTCIGRFLYSYGAHRGELCHFIPTVPSVGAVQACWSAVLMPDAPGSACPGSVWAERDLTRVTVESCAPALLVGPCLPSEPLPSAALGCYTGGP